MNYCKTIALLLMLGFAIAVTGCGGGGANVQATNTTIGAELQDLKNALDEGIITEKEYKKAKKNILKKYD